MPIQLTTLLGKAVRKAALLRGGGSALPGLFVEKIDKNFISRTLAQLPLGVVVVSGTNGKTTTTKIIVELLEGQGMKVFTNRTGSNFTRGVAAALLGDIDARGRLDADIAVLELDEAHAVHFVHAVKPRYSLFLNVMRDQLDRFGEIDTTASLLETVAKATTDGVVVNNDDPRLSSQKFTNSIRCKITTYGVSQNLLTLFPSDDTMRSDEATAHRTVKQSDVQLVSIEDGVATIHIGGHRHQVILQLKGVYNTLNAVGALALARIILNDDKKDASLVDGLKRVQPAFGRGETIVVDGRPCELVLVKNPSGFRLSLSSFDAHGYDTMIAINDDYADGRDMSWLWDVDFDSLRKTGVSIVTGVRAYDMGLRLHYDEVAVRGIETDLSVGLERFLSEEGNSPRRIYCTYTAMLGIRKLLARRAPVKEIL